LFGSIAAKNSSVHHVVLIGKEAAELPLLLDTGRSVAPAARLTHGEVIWPLMRYFLSGGSPVLVTSQLIPD
jgi:hypothetical protein